MRPSDLNSPRSAAAVIGVVALFFLVLTLPLATERVAGGRSSERQGYTAGIIRIYCQEPGHSVLAGPQIHFGRNPFNLELTIFEKLQGLAARAISHGECDLAVERVGKYFSIAMSALGIVAVAGVAWHLWGPLAAALAALLLGTDELWLRYSTYTMIENRVLTLGVLAILASLKRRPVAAGLLWALTFMQKPQIFVFLTAFWGITELLRARSLGKLFAEKRFRALCGAYLGAVVVSLAWFKWTAALDVKNDLPWIIHTGPRISRWYFGDWAERTSLKYAKNLLLAWFRETGLSVALPIALVLFAVRQARAERADPRELLKRALPMLAALFFYTFIFWNVFIVHEYYALPINIGRSLATGGVLALVLLALPTARKLRPLAAIIAITVAIVVARFAFVGVRDYENFVLHLNDPAAWNYQADWNHPVFPKKYGFAVVAVPGTGRDLLFLYMASQRGFVWCSSNPVYAPRAFWKSQGVEYVAWTDHMDPATHRMVYTVRSIDDELAYARARGWSSDIKDVWAGRSMAEWSRLASENGRDPCLRSEDQDPRKWEQPRS
ncbi:MAG: hypothetical protein HY075_14570 [Deltaproteobacteria bacterium]|nr:hypothetical protein [Deltaproteobacteria bacterium]